MEKQNKNLSNKWGDYFDPQKFDKRRVPQFYLENHNKSSFAYIFFLKCCIMKKRGEKNVYNKK